jgi:hypothetical protein
MDTKRQLLRHFLAALAYRTQKALRGAPEDFADFRAESFMRTPHELILHMTGVILFARSLFDSCETWPEKKPTFAEEIERFHDTLEALAQHLDSDREPRGTTLERLLQGPLSDAMTHVGQIALLRRLHGSPVPGEGFMLADIQPSNLTSDQPLPVRPDKVPIKPGQEGDATE